MVLVTVSMTQTGAVRVAPGGVELGAVGVNRQRRVRLIADRDGGNNRVGGGVNDRHRAEFPRDIHPCAVRMDNYPLRIKVIAQPDGGRDRLRGGVDHRDRIAG